MSIFTKEGVLSRLGNIADDTSRMMEFDNILREAALFLDVSDGDVIASAVIESEYSGRINMLMLVSHRVSPQMRALIRKEVIAAGDWFRLFELAHAEKIAVTAEELLQLMRVLRAQRKMPWGSIAENFLFRVDEVEGMNDFLRRRICAEIEKSEPPRKLPPRKK